MSRYTDLSEVDLMVTIGMDYAVQFWITDADGDPLPINSPAKMTVRTVYGSILFETKDAITDIGIDYLNDPVLQVSAANGMVQLSIPRNLTSTWPIGAFKYDIWGTVDQGDPAEGSDWQDSFPEEQHLPLAKGNFLISQRITVMED